jgi:hypothetical protein
MPFATGPQLRYIGNGRYLTCGPTMYVGGRDVLTIPPDFPTDLASVPRPFWALLPPNGTYERAAVLHDWLCVRLAAGDSPVPSRDTDGLFRRVAREGGAGFLTRWHLWAGVRIGALFNKHRRPGITRDLPLVALIGALDLTVLGLAVQGLHKLAHAIGV